MVRYGVHHAQIVCGDRQDFRWSLGADLWHNSFQYFRGWHNYCSRAYTRTHGFNFFVIFLCHF